MKSTLLKRFLVSGIFSAVLMAAMAIWSACSGSVFVLVLFPAALAAILFGALSFNLGRRPFEGLLVSVLFGAVSAVLIIASPRLVAGGVTGFMDDLGNGFGWFVVTIVSAVSCTLVAAICAFLHRSSVRRGEGKQLRLADSAEEPNK